MKILITGFIGGVALLMGSLVNAGGPGDLDDNYISFQVRIPLDTNRQSLFSGRNEYSIALINQTDGIKSGLLFKQDLSGNQGMDYVASDFALPLVVRNRNGVYRSNVNGPFVSGVAVVLGAVAAVALTAAVVKKAATDIAASTAEAFDNASE